MIQRRMAPITGGEAAPDPATTSGALSEFYRAFNGRDLRLAEANWENTDDASMDNPLGGIRRGWAEIRQLYERLFAGPGRIEVEFWDYTLHVAEPCFWAVGRERGVFRPAAGRPIELAIRTSRLFRRDSAERWRQVHHHGSIEDPELLKAYRSAALGEGG